MTQQEVFDKVVRHLLTQKKAARAAIDFSGCLYRSPDGLKCAVGCLIPDRLYDPEMEGLQVENLLNRFEKLDRYFRFSKATKLLAEELQSIHDEYQPKNWRRALKSVGTKFKLKWPKGF